MAGSERRRGRTRGGRAVRRLAARAGAPLLLLATLLAACGGNEGVEPARGDADAAAGGERPLAPGGATATAGHLNDGQITALVRLINGSELSAAKAVQPKLAATAVRAYAGALIADHTRLGEALVGLPSPKAAPVQFTTLNAIFHSQAATLGTLPAGYPFDAIFVATQVIDHAMAIDSLFRWREIAQDAELRRVIDAAIPVLQSHLRQAQALYARLDQRVDLGRPGPADTVRPVSPPGPATVPATRAVPADTARGGGPPADTAAHDHGRGGA